MKQAMAAIFLRRAADDEEEAAGRERTPLSRHVRTATLLLAAGLAGLLLLRARPTAAEEKPAKEKRP